MRSVLKYFANFVFQQSDKIICLSNHERLSMLENLDVQKEKIDVVPLGLDLDDKRIPAARQRTGSLRLLYVGRLERYKGVQLILWALSRLEEKDVELSVVGYGTFADELRRLANRLDLGRRVTFLGRIDDTKLDQVYRDCDVLVSPSMFESFGMTFLEAMSHGKAVISTDVGVMYDICLYNELQRHLALTMPPTSQELMEKIRLVIESRDLIDEICRRNLDLLNTRYTWKRVCESMIRIYASLIEGGAA